MSPAKRTSHAVYDLKYHVVWIPKYRKTILTEAIVLCRLKCNRKGNGCAI
ncbi:MAG: transposase [Ignavibacteriales bacterium]